MSKTLLKSTSIVSGMTMISRILGFVRDMVVAQLFGAGAETDAFFVAFKLPNFMRRLFAEGAFSQAFVPVFMEYKTNRTQEELRLFLSHILGNLALIVFIVMVIGILFSPVLVMIFAPGFAHHGLRFELAIHMLRLTFPYLFFVSLVACIAAVLNSFSRFAASSITPIWLNLVLIACAYGLYHVFAFPIYALAWGVLFAGIAQLLFILFFLRRLGLMPKLSISFKDPGVRRVLTLMGPAIFGVSVAQINLFVDTFFASFLVAGSVSWLYYSERLMTFPLGVFAVAVGTVVLPHLSQKNAQNHQTAFSNSIDWGLRLLLFVGLPCTVTLLFLAGPMLSTLFQYGVFGAQDVLMARESLIAYAVGVPFLMVIKVLASGFYAKQNIRTPVRIAAIAMLVNIVFNMALIVPLAHAGIALATSLAAMANALLLLWLLKRKNIFQPRKGWGLFAMHMLIANGLMAVFLWFATNSLTVWVSRSGVWRLSHLLVLLLVSSVIYLFVLYLLRFDFRLLVRHE